MNDRRYFLTRVSACLCTVATVDLSRQARSSASSETRALHKKHAERFPYFQTQPVSYLHVRLEDDLWASRQKITHDVSLDWISRSHDKSGGITAFRKDPAHYVADIPPEELEHVKFVEAMATMVGVHNDASIAGLIEAWAKPLIAGQAADGYLAERFPIGPAHPPIRWDAISWSHEDYYIGNYLEAAIAYQEATGNDELYRSAVRAVDNMARSLLSSDHAYAPGHSEIEQALMRLYELSGDDKYCRLCGWLLDQRGQHTGRASYGRYSQDHIPIKKQRTIEGHAVRAGFLFNGVTNYVGATGDPAYREAVLAIWDDFVTRKMYLHGASGNQSSRNEGYRRNPYCIPPDDVYGESCAAFANFQWAHSLFRLTSDARYIDVAERILYNVFYASLSLKGDSSFYCNPAQTNLPDELGQITPRVRSQILATSCCPPNIIKLSNKIGGFLYSTDSEGIYVKHYCASDSKIPWRDGTLRLVQRGKYPWDGAISLSVAPQRPEIFALRLRIPDWADSYRVSVNGKPVELPVTRGWVVLHRRWHIEDQVDLALPMRVRRVTMPPQFVEYQNLAALQRGPIVYCLEEQDVEDAGSIPFAGMRLATVYLPKHRQLVVEHRSGLLGGVTVLKGEVNRVDYKGDEKALRVTFVPYGVWGNRKPGEMRIWLAANKAPLTDLLVPILSSGESCIG